MIRTLEGILAAAKRMARRRTVVLAGAEQEEGLKSLDDACRQGIVRPVLIGDRDKLARLARSLAISLRSMEVVHEPDPGRATQQAVAMCRQRHADILMKGTVSTDMILRAVLDRQTGLATGKLLSHVTVFESPTHKRLMFMSDPAVNVNPDVSRKLDIIQNAVIVARKLGLDRPKVALLAATERINVKDMPATTDAAIITQMYESGQLTGAEVAGPYGLDIAVSPFAAKCKNVVGPVAGCADIFICPDINCANVFYKVLVYFAGAEMANAMLGAQAPIVMTSRSDTSLTKLYTIALSVMLAGDE
jgi:phosphate butyryltransferase